MALMAVQAAALIAVLKQYRWHYCTESNAPHTAPSKQHSGHQHNHHELVTGPNATKQVTATMQDFNILQKPEPTTRLPCTRYSASSYSYCRHVITTMVVVYVSL